MQLVGELHYPNLLPTFFLTQDELRNIGSLYKIQVSSQQLQLREPWHLALLHMKHTGTNQETWLTFDCWFKPNEDVCVELPAFSADHDPLPGKIILLLLQRLGC